MKYMHYMEVAPTSIVRQDQATLVYHSSSPIAVGALVKIPVGKTIRTGLVVAVAQKPEYDTRDIVELIDTAPLPQPLIATARWISEYYSSHLALVLQTILPSHPEKSRRKKSPAQSDAKPKRTNFVLNPDQQNAVDTIATSPNKTHLLHGITGSGKTQVYIEAIRAQHLAGKSAILLVPEISLTAQLYQRIAAEFDNVVLAHSRQTESERHQIWLSVLRDTSPKVIIGPRSALFLPEQHLGLIIIDEAHEPSYKQDKSPRYQAQRVAKILAKQHGAALVLGSATPSVEDYYLAKQADAIIEMPSLAQPSAQKADIQIIDMTKRDNFTAHRFISNQLIAQIEQNLVANRQTLLFHNRRGSAGVTMCENCGWQGGCPRCFVPLTLHADHHRLVCHICGQQSKVPTSCPECGAADVIHKGIGTKAIESAAQSLFPRAIIARFDGDTESSQTLDKRYDAVARGDVDIIIGTQVIAKGLDLPHLATVGIVQADSGLSLPDFASAERTFQLLSQAVGRVGRSSKPTSATIQTYQPSHPAIVDSASQNYAEFYERTIKLRRHTTFPPFTYLLKAVCVYKTEATAIKNAQKLAAELRHSYPDVEILGPAPAFYERVRDTYRWQLVIKSVSRAKLQSIATHIPAKNWQFELDPLSLL